MVFCEYAKTQVNSKIMMVYNFLIYQIDYYGLSKFIAIIFFIFSVLFYTSKDS